MSGDKRRDPSFGTTQKLWCDGADSDWAKERVEARNRSQSGMFIVGSIARKTEVICRRPRVSAIMEQPAAAPAR